MNGNELKEKYELNVSVRAFVEFIMRSGDIDNRGTGQLSKNAMTEGSKIHRKIQNSMGIDYKAEVPLKTVIDYNELRINLEGRADGIITNSEGVTIDEIKGVYKNVKKMTEIIPVHQAQAICYAWIYAKEHQLEKIFVQLTYCNLDDETIKRFKKEYTFKEIDEYFTGILDKFVMWAEFIATEKKLRNASIKNLEFPFEYRDGQRNIVVSVYKNILKKKKLYIQAPTGVGKTISTVFPAVRALGENAGDKIFYLTAKTITRTVAEEAYETLRENGLHFKSVTLTAKEKICANFVSENQQENLPEDDQKIQILAKKDVTCNPDKCERAKGHFDRVNDAIFDIISNEDNITREVIEKYADKHKVCPFEFSLDISNFMDGIICDYNYAFDPRARLKRYFSDFAKGPYIFLVDEAHNLVERAREMYSAVIVKEDFLKCKKLLKDKSKGVVNALDKCNRAMLELKRECIGEGEKYTYTLLDETDDLVTKMLRLQGNMQRFLDDNKEFSGRDQVLDMYFKVCTYLDTYELVDDKYQIYSDFNTDGEFYVKLYCVNPSGNLSQCMEQGFSTILFSATLLPVNYYKEMLSGNLEDDAIYIDSPFDSSKRIIVLANDVSSKYTRRGPEEYLRIATYIEKIISGCYGNYMVFFPSYKMMEDIYKILITRVSDYEIICQNNGMNEMEREEFLDNFAVKNGLIGFCVLGGIFSEGIDLKNERLIGSIIVGTGLPQVCSERELLKNYYDKNGRNGFDYAYKFPGMNKVLQAAGRVIRTKEDFGVIALLDERFMQRTYSSLFPREWCDLKVCNIGNVDKEVGHFWKYL